MEETVRLFIGDVLKNRSLVEAVIANPERVKKIINMYRETNISLFDYDDIDECRKAVVDEIMNRIGLENF